MVLHPGGCGRVGHRRTHIRLRPRQIRRGLTHLTPNTTPPQGPPPAHRPPNAFPRTLSHILHRIGQPSPTSCRFWTHPLPPPCTDPRPGHTTQAPPSHPTPTNCESVSEKPAGTARASRQNPQQVKERPGKTCRNSESVPRCEDSHDRLPAAGKVAVHGQPLQPRS